MTLGTLTGFLDLDASAFDGALGGAADKLREFGGKGSAAASAAGVKQGEELANGWVRGADGKIRDAQGKFVSAGELAAAGLGEGFDKKALKWAAGAGLAVGTALAAGVLGAMNVEAANDKLAAQLGLNAAESERLGGVAGALYANAYGGSLEEVSTAVGAVVSSIEGMRDASAGVVEEMTAKALDFATAFEVDVTRAVQVVGQAVSSGLAPNAASAMDLMTASMQKVPAAVREDLMDAIDEYGPFMASIGIQGQEAFGLLVAASEKGMYGIDKTGDALKEFTIRATDMSAASKVGFDALGLSQEDMTRKILAGGDSAAGAFDKIVTGLLGMKDPAAQSQAALALFGTPLEDLSVTEMPRFLESLASGKTALGETAGAAKAMGETLNDNASTNLEAFKRQVTSAFVDFVGGKALPIVNDIAAALATGFGPALTTVSNILTGEVVPALVDTQEWLGEHETTTKVLAGVITALMIPTLVRLAVGYATTATAAVVSSATQTAAWLRTQVQALATGVVLAATYALTVAGWIASAAAATAGGIAIAAAWLLALGPVGLVIAGVVAVIAIFTTAWKTSETFRDIVKGAMGVVQRAAGDAVGFLVQGFKGLLTVWLAVAEGIVKGAATALGWVPGIGPKLKAAETAFGVMKKNILGTLDSIADQAHGFGEATGQGLARGIDASRSSAVRAAQRTAEATAGAMRQGLQVASPSKLTTYYGQMLGEGLVVGMLDSAGAVDAASGQLAKAALPSMGTATLPVGVTRGGDGASASAGAPTGAIDLTELVGEMRAVRDELRRQTDQQRRLAQSEPDRVPA